MKSRKNIIRLILISLLVFGIDLYAQEKNKDKTELAKNMSLKLQQKVLLSDEQTAKIETILEEYIDSNKRNEQGSADKKIEAMLDKKQKAKYDIIKDDWWSEVNSAFEK